jgi:ATP-dependent DNA helicase RecG
VQTDELTQLIATMRELGTDLADVEAKASSIALPKSVKESLSAFANTSGGTIILGLAEENGFAATGVSDPAKISADLASMCSSELDPPLRPVISQIRVEGAWLVVAEVPELGTSQKPCFVKARGMSKGSYIRVHDGDQAMSAFEVQMLLSNRGQPTDDLAPVPNTSKDVS